MAILCSMNAFFGIPFPDGQPRAYPLSLRPLCTAQGAQPGRPRKLMNLHRLPFRQLAASVSLYKALGGGGSATAPPLD